MVKNNSSKAVLIIGDWLVDEYWFLVRHHSDISSHTGYYHYRLKNSGVRSALCGAGHVAKLLYLSNLKQKKYNIYGLGNWNKKDEGLIYSLLKNSNKNKKISLSLTPKKRKIPSNVFIKSLNPKGPTTQVFRQYHDEEKGQIQINRVDREFDTAGGTVKLCFPGNRWLPPKKNVKAIIVHDLMKGAVSTDLIKDINKKYKNVPWYVRSKNRDPDWLSCIENSVRLQLIGPEIAALISPWECWLTNGRVGKQALETIEELSCQNSVLLSDNREIIIRHEGKNIACIKANHPTPRTPVSELGWSSAVFSSLVWEMLNSGNRLTKDVIERTRSKTSNFGNFEVTKKQLGRKKFREKAGKKPPKNFDGTIKQERNIWKQARLDCGIIDEKNNKPYLEVWRGSSNLPGYISCIKEKEGQLNNIARNLRTFQNSESPIRSLSIMIQADPGSGKTYLAKCLAKSFGFSFLRFDVTQMTHREELIDLFENVASEQADSNKKVLVFVDEINALIEGSQAYGAFLTPLEEGIYMRRGRYFSLKPAVWFFAGTKLDADKLKKGEKLSDFKSRMSIMESIDYDSLKKRYSKMGSDNLPYEARLEQVYLGATMIRHHFSDVQYVSKEVLNLFKNMDPASAPARKIRKMAGSLRNVQYGRVTRKNFDNSGKIGWDKKLKNRDKLIKLIF